MAAITQPLPGQSSLQSACRYDICYPLSLLSGYRPAAFNIEKTLWLLLARLCGNQVDQTTEKAAEMVKIEGGNGINLEVRKLLRLRCF
jgi:hypothetical protein